MKNGIAYSFHVRTGSFQENRCFNQMLYSVTTLRKYNKNIDVNVFIAASKPQHFDFYKWKDLNINFIIFSNTSEDYGTNWYPAWYNLGYAEFLFHRWKNAYRCLREHQYDNLLYLDTDTVFHNDPELLFNKYGNCDFVWAKEDNTFGTMAKIGLDKAMNDGQFILSKNILKHEAKSLKHIQTYTNKTLIEFEGKLEDDFEHLNLHWLCVQYAMFDYFNAVGKPVHYFDPTEVMLHVEPNYNDTSNLILHHYYNGNAKLFIPKEFYENFS